MATEIPPQQSVRAHLALVKSQAECAERDLWNAFSVLTEEMRKQTADIRLISKRQLFMCWGMGFGFLVTITLELLR